MKNITVDKFKSNYMTTKEDVCIVLESIKKAYKHKYGNFELATNKFSVFINYIDQFIDKVNTTRFCALEDWWFYSIRIEPKMMCLNLNYLNDCNNNDDDSINFVHVCEWIILDIKSLSVKEYALNNNVEDGTVRQWIRRGKLLDAYKVGSEWRIPELASVDEETSKTHQFIWKEPGPFLPDEYIYLTKSKVISIYKEPHKNKYVIYTNGEKHIVSKQEKEKIELMLISNSMINYHSNNFIEVLKKDELFYV